MFVLETPISWTTCWYTPFPLQHNAYTIHTLCYLSPHHFQTLLSRQILQESPWVIQNLISCFHTWSFLSNHHLSVYFTYHNTFVTISTLLFFLNHPFCLVLLVVRNSYPAPVPTPPGHKECQLTLDLKSGGGCFPPKTPWKLNIDGRKPANHLGCDRNPVNNGISTTNLNWWVYRMSEPSTRDTENWLALDKTFPFILKRNWKNMWFSFQGCGHNL